MLDNTIAIRTFFKLLKNEDKTYSLIIEKIKKCMLIILSILSH